MDNNKIQTLIPGAILHDYEEIKAKPIRHTGKYTFESLVSNWRLVKKSLQSVTYNVASNQEDDPKLITIDFSEFKIPSPRTKKLRPLTEFKHICHNSVFFIADRLIAHTDNSELQNTIKARFNIVLNLYRFLNLRNKYYLRDATYNDLHDYVNILANGGTYKALELEPYYKSIVKKIKTDKEYARKISSFNNGAVSLSDSIIKEKIGITPPRHNAPKYLYDLACEIQDVEHLKSAKGFDIGDSVCNVTPKHLTTINQLYLLSEETDRLTFSPFTARDELFKELKGRIYGSTENITLEDALSVLKTCNQWIYEYGDNIISFGEKFREQIESVKDKDGMHKIWASNAEWLREYWDNESKESNSHPELSKEMTTSSFKAVLETLQTACMVMIAINNGRRKNELIGLNRSYGLYYGCLQKSENEIIEDNKIDIYIEKTVQNYCLMSCNKLTIDAVNILEKVYVLLRPIGEEVPEYKKDINDRRKDKLLITKTFSLDGLSKESGKFREKNEKQFYSLTGVKNEKLHQRHHPYRRLFAMLYFYRFQLSSLPALSQQLMHFNYEMTLVYVSDDDMREVNESLERLYKIYKSENQVMDGVFTETEHVFLKDIVSLTLEGLTAGGLSKKITRIHKWLLRSATKDRDGLTYKEHKDNERIDILTGALESKGYGAKPRRHGVCGSDSKGGKCFNEEEGVLRRENGVPMLCVRCHVHGFTNEFLDNLREDQEKLRNQKEDYGLSRAERSRASKGLDNNIILVVVAQTRSDSYPFFRVTVSLNLS